MVAFPSPHRALRCAIDIQQGLDKYALRRAGEAIRVRIGLHTGEALRTANGYFGKHVILSSRIAENARGGEILVSSLLRELVERTGEFRFDHGRVVGLKGLAGEYRVFQVRWAAPGSAPPVTEHSLAHCNVFRRTGDVWTIAYEGRSTHLRNAKGLQYIARLLREPEREFHVLELTGSCIDPGSGGGVGPLLDGRAKAAYRRRLIDLRDELGDAEGCNDVGRTANVREEIEALTDQLAAAVGLNGRDRVFASHVERARVAVRTRIAASMRKIGDAHPALGHHLATNIKTGRHCVYRPDPTRAPSWSLDGYGRI
jgi:hypothetical protein